MYSTPDWVGKKLSMEFDQKEKIQWFLALRIPTPDTPCSGELIISETLKVVKTIQINIIQKQKIQKRLSAQFFFSSEDALSIEL